MPQSRTWHNWSGGQHATPSALLHPDDEDTLRDIVRRASNLRVTGAGHSFPPLVPTDGAIVNLDRLSGVIDHNQAQCTARMWAGTRLYDAGPALHAIGQGMPNLGDIDQQSLAGVLGTATHGTGITLPCIAAGVTGLRMITAAGDVVECSREKNADLFKAAAVSLGALGVITQVTLQNVAAYRLREKVHVEVLDDLLPHIDALARQHLHFELWAFPHSRMAIVKTLDATNDPPTNAKYGADSDDAALWIGCELMRLLPPAGRGMQKLLKQFIKPSERVNWSHHIYASKRNVRFNEMEYQVPAAQGAPCLDEICHTFARDKSRVFIPVEFRFVAADDLWLSPFHGQADDARCAISIHQYHKQDYRPLFALAEPILQRHDGRPHWGKLHALKADRLRALYPHFDDFLALRRKLDPHGKFLNRHLCDLFGVTAA